MQGTHEMQHGPLVSIITIFLDAEAFLGEAIESVLAQSFTSWELLLVDDGSRDGSTALARDYAGRCSSRVRYLEHEGHMNRGMSASRNLGLRHARGTYIAFLDADDVWMPNKLERQVHLLEEHRDAGFVCGRTEWWYSWTGNPEDRNRDFLQKFTVPLNTVVAPPALLDMFLEDEWASLCDVMVRRCTIETVGGYEEIFRGMYEDQAFHAKLSMHFPAYVADECWYRYRQHERACTAQSHRTGHTMAARHAFLCWLEGYLARHGRKGTSTWRIVRRQLFPLRHPHVVRASTLVRRIGRKVVRILTQTQE